MRDKPNIDAYNRVNISNNLSETSETRRFLNGWSKEQERLMSEWSDIASCYRWLHDTSEKVYHTKTLWINLPVIILSTLGGTANFGIQSLFGDDDTSKKYASFAIGGISLVAGLLTTVGNYLRYAQFEESHRVAGISWGKFQRLVAVELALAPNDRMDSMDFIKICRTELDRLIEQSPPIPKEYVSSFEKKFGRIKDLKKPEICGALEHTNIFESSETRLKHLAVEAALMLKRKKQTLNELVTPEIEKKIAQQIETRLTEAIEMRKKNLEEEIEYKKNEAIKLENEMQEVLNERKKRIQDEIITEKVLMMNTLHNNGTSEPSTATQFESRLNYNKTRVNDKEVKQNASVENDNIIIIDRNQYRT